MATAESIRIAEEYQRLHATAALTEAQAKLYSQSMRRQLGRPGLATFRIADVDRALEESLALIQFALLVRSENDEGDWKESLKRAAELMEWLSRADLRPQGSPMHLLAAAAYQVAGYPAMALGQLARLPEDDPSSQILSRFLRGDFRGALIFVNGYWREEIGRGVDRDFDDLELSHAAVTHVIRCIGTICSYLRFGQDDMLQRAIEKLERLSKAFLYSRDSYSSVLAQLTAIVARTYTDVALWRSVTTLRNRVSPDTRDALNQFARAQFRNGRCLIWPAQAAGIERLREGTSFALCTPTGSGKTTVATLGIIPALFEPNPNLPEGLEALRDNLVLYVVPSRALAAEVEHRLDQDLRGISAHSVVVTGLYGGTDWGPTEAWIARDQPTILICTFEKADALLRFLGPLFLNRVRLVIIDEAHTVNGAAREDDESAGANRQFRLELLGSRLNMAREIYQFRILALSAVAASSAAALARWVSGDPNARPTESFHRGTRQMLGRLEVGRQGAFTVHYDLMNGRSLQFTEGRGMASPFVAELFPRLPGGLNFDEGPEVRMRAPTLWAALNLAAERTEGVRRTVLISITQNIESFAASCVTLLDQWRDQALPEYFEPERDEQLLADCLASVADYFSEDSSEFKLLSQGIAVHHGKLPTPVGRRLKRLIDRGRVRVIIATSTLSEGVNIPVNYVLIPSVYRSNSRFSLQEFSNLIGRAGRPGVATEGHSLVMLADAGARDRQRLGYNELRNELERATRTAAGAQDAAESP